MTVCKHLGGSRFQAVQLSDRPGRIAAGQFKPGKYPQVVLAPGDGNGPLLLLQCQGDPQDSKSWVGRKLVDREVIAGHTLAVADINGDGHLDIFCAEMHTPGNKKKCTAWLLYGDGQGNFQMQELSVGIGNHEHFGRDGSIDTIERGHALAIGRAPHHDLPVLEKRVVKSVKRLPALQQHVVGHVDNVVDRPHAAERQTTLHPQGTGPQLGAGQNPGRIAGACHVVLNAHPRIRFHVLTRFFVINGRQA